MKRFAALLQTTWWLWLIYFGGCVALTIFEPFMIVTFPLLVFIFLYFAYVRFDEEGNRRV